MMNIDKIVRLGQSIWRTTYYDAGEKSWVTPHHYIVTLNFNQDKNMTEHI